MHLERAMPDAIECRAIVVEQCLARALRRTAKRRRKVVTVEDAIGGRLTSCKARERPEHVKLRSDAIDDRARWNRPRPPEDCRNTYAAFPCRGLAAAQETSRPTLVEICQPRSVVAEKQHQGSSIELQLAQCVQHATYVEIDFLD